MQYPICRHIKTDGLRCKAPALASALYCYFHHRLLERHRPYRHTDATRGSIVPGQHIELTALEDRASIQVALSVVVNALATGQLDPRRATAILYGLQLASSNVTQFKLHPFVNDLVRSCDPTPDGLDMAVNT